MCSILFFSFDGEWSHFWQVSLMEWVSWRYEKPFASSSSTIPKNDLIKWNIHWTRRWTYPRKRTKTRRKTSNIRSDLFEEVDQDEDLWKDQWLNFRSFSMKCSTWNSVGNAHLKFSSNLCSNVIRWANFQVCSNPTNHRRQSRMFLQHFRSWRKDCLHWSNEKSQDILFENEKKKRWQRNQQ